jgi:hypothetical protein
VIEPFEIVGEDKLWEIPGDWTHGNQSDEYGCHRCGKKVGKKPATVHVVAGGGTLLSNEYGIDKFSQFDEESGHEEAGGDMYWFPIGSECKRHVPAEFVFEASS